MLGLLLANRGDVWSLDPSETRIAIHHGSAMWTIAFTAMASSHASAGPLSR